MEQSHKKIKTVSLCFLASREFLGIGNPLITKSESSTHPGFAMNVPVMASLRKVDEL